MQAAVALARAGIGATFPNPSVGAVVVREGRIIGRGRTGPAGTAHAEVRALARAGAGARGATLYVTLEPCAHHGRTPPCTEAIHAAGIARVVVGIVDPSPRVRGRGIRWLRRRGIEVTVGVGRRACRAAHEFYLHHETTGRPFVTLKTAQTLDGCIATAGGESRWITSAPARRHAHGLRARHQAILVGAGTVLADDPRLSVRHVRGEDPIPVVLDTHLRSARRRRAVFRPGTFVFHGAGADAQIVRRLRRWGCVPLSVATGRAGVDPAAVLEALGRMSVRSLLVEGGARVAGSFLAADLVDRLVVYRAPKVVGRGSPGIEGWAAPRLQDARRFARRSVEAVGPDLVCVYDRRRRGRS